MSGGHTPGPWSVPHFAEPAVNCHCGYVLVDGYMGAICTVHASGHGDDWLGHGDNPKFKEAVANARLIASAPDLLAALVELADVFALDGEGSIERFERLAAMFRKDTGYLAPGKDQPMGGSDQPDGDKLRAIYDAWYSGKVTRARAAISLATGESK